MKFPRPTKMLPNGCIAVVQTNTRKGQLMLKDRYPLIKVRGKTWRGHRLSYHLNVKKIPRSPIGLKRGLILHTCHHKWCINPKHLYKGTALQNIIDLLEAGGEEYLKLLSSRQLGRKHSEETKNKISKSHIGIFCSQETKLKIAKANTGRVWSEEAKRAMSLKLTGRPKNKTLIKMGLLP